MSMTITGMSELANDLADMARRVSSTSSTTVISSILNEAAQPVYEAAQRFAPERSGKLKAALKIGKLQRRKGGGYYIKIGSHKEDDAFYASFVEFGHGGPHPAPPHPFLRPAYDTTKEQAYAIIRERLGQEISKSGG